MSTKSQQKRTVIVAMSALAMLVAATCAASLPASQLALDVSLSNAVLLADEMQTAYLRVGLRGFAIEKPEQRTPVNIAIVIDKSGSMSGEKIEKAKEAAIMAINRLSSRDIISVITYDSTVHVLVPATKVSDKESIFQAIRRINSGGSTALFAGVSKGAQEMRKFLAKNMVNRLVLISDGLANVGPSSPGELGALGSSLVKDGISVTTIGLGLGYNEDLMTKLAYNSDGSHYFAENAGELAKVFEKEFGRALSVVAQEIQANIICAPGIRPVRLLGRQGQIDGQNVVVSINQLYSEHEKFILLEIEVPATAIGQTRKVASVSVRYDNMKTHTSDKLGSEVEVKFSDSKSLIKERTNANVMVDVVELVAIERNELAVQLRDKGQIEEARRELKSNEKYLSKNYMLFKSMSKKAPKLKVFAEIQMMDAEGIADESNWSKQRKGMKEQQYQRQIQQAEPASRYKSRK